MIAAQMNPAAMTREEPGKWGSLVLAVCIHGALALLLYYGVQWQTRPPEPVQVDLVRSLPPLPQPQVVRPPEPMPPPKPVPKEEPPPLKKPDIALPKAPEKPIKKEKPPVEPPKPVEKPQPKPDKVPPAEPKPQQRSAREIEADRQRLMLDLASDEARRKAQAQTNAKNKAELDSATTQINARARDAWIAAISQKVGSLLSTDIPFGSQQPVFIIELLPTGEVGAVHLQTRSGNKALDDAIERAIKKASPLPRPTRPEVFDRNLQFVFKPRTD